MCDMLSHSKCRKALQEAKSVYSNTPGLVCFGADRINRLHARTCSFNSLWQIAEALVTWGLGQGRGAHYSLRYCLNWVR
jgi:hypothetical protein